MRMAPRDIISGKRVLIVDDEQDVLDTLVDLLVPCLKSSVPDNGKTTFYF